MRQFKLSDFWQSATMALVLWSFVRANLGNEPSMHLWETSAEALLVLLGVGVGGKMMQRPIERWVDRKYGNQDIGTGGEP